jgi:nucleoside-diphosphate-sugar epimerase
MKALVTGGLGFIGSNLVQLLLSKDYDVTVIDNLSSGYKENVDSFDVQVIEGDIRNRTLLLDSMRGIDIVFHLAASVGRQKSIDNPQEDSEVNIIGTLNIIEGMKKHAVNKIVYSSSAAIYGELKTEVINETHPINPDSPYGVSKLAAEKHILASADLYGFKAICLRYFNVYGINQRYDVYGNVIPIFAHRIYTNESLTIYGNGQQTRDFINVKDVAMANYLVSKELEKTEVYNLGSGRSITINQLAESMRKISGINNPIHYAPKRPGDVLHCKADITRIQKDLEFYPSSKIEEGLMEYLKWYQSDLKHED